MNILITGGQGMLGKALQDEFSSQKLRYVALDKSSCDITNPESLRTNINKYKPTHLINCAAYTAVDKAEEEIELAHAINATGVANVAKACHDGNISLVHISTDYVFDGTADQPYLETHPTNPLSVYGASKLEGERLLLQHCPSGSIVRTQWLYGPYGKHFVGTMLSLSQRYDRLTVVDDQIGSPTYTRDLANGLYQLLFRPTSGVIHLRNSGQASWYDLAIEIFAQQGISIDVAPVDTSQYPLPATRPKHSVLSMQRWETEIQGTPMPHWKTGLRNYLQSLS